MPSATDIKAKIPFIYPKSGVIDGGREFFPHDGVQNGQYMY